SRMLRRKSSAIASTSSSSACSRATSACSASTRVSFPLTTASVCDSASASGRTSSLASTRVELKRQHFLAGGELRSLFFQDQRPSPPKRFEHQLEISLRRRISHYTPVGRTAGQSSSSNAATAWIAPAVSLSDGPNQGRHPGVVSPAWRGVPLSFRL